MGWIVGYMRISERDRWTFSGMFHGIVGWDGQWDTRASVKGTDGHPVECPTIPWDSGMGWTVGYTRICERDRWISRGMSHNPMGSWDRMDSGIHAHL